MVELPLMPDTSHGPIGNWTDSAYFAALLVSLLIILLAAGCALALRTGLLFEKVAGCTGL